MCACVWLCVYASVCACMYMYECVSVRMRVCVRVACVCHTVRVSVGMHVCVGLLYVCISVSVYVPVCVHRPEVDTPGVLRYFLPYSLGGGIRSGPGPCWVLTRLGGEFKASLAPPPTLAVWSQAQSHAWFLRGS